MSQAQRPATEVSRFDPIAWWAAHDPGRVALVEAMSGRTWSYAALHALADRWCAALARIGVESGDRIALLARNRVEHLVLLAACTRSGSTLVPLNWRLAAPELARVLADARPRVLLVTEAFSALADDAARQAGMADVQCCELDRDGPRVLAMAGEHAVLSRDADRIAAAPAMLLYTSGSTGSPKGVIVPHRQLHWNAAATIAGWELSSRDVGVVASPLFHTAGWGVFALPLLAAGGRLVLFDAFEPDAVMTGLHTYAVTVCFGVPTQYDLLRTAASWGRPLPALRWMLSGGAPCPRRLHDAVVEVGYPFREGYGLTECGPNCFTTTDAIAHSRPGSVGHLMPHLEARLVGDDGRPVPPGTVGDLELRGPQLFDGYFDNAERTAEALTADGWLRTGDLAMRDPDGIWAISGRRKEMYITGGENVFPGEVENALLLCRGVRQAAVVALPDTQWGEVGGAVVVPATGHGALTEHTLLAELRQRLAGYKVPRVVRFADALPTLGTGKVDRQAVTALLAAHADEARGSGAEPSH